MEYVFGTAKRRGVLCECLRTKGTNHTNLSGNVTVEISYPDQIITDKFWVVEKFRSKIDEEGNCYDWYELRDHYRYIDKYTPNIGGVEERLQSDIADTQNAICEESTDMENRLSDIENAICELSELLEGGN